MPSTPLPKRIVRTVNCGDNAWDEERKAIVLVGSVPFTVSYPVLHLWSVILIFWELCGGWTSQVERFVARGWLIGAGNSRQ
ncbi:MAG TPA: hypothetical protein VHZ51_14040 [Ktedonobacteraceae bacterium]|nr:hypothetical protein [Ktedonobacteraceae bacterium]